jgi:hypothetical protein
MQWFRRRRLLAVSEITDFDRLTVEAELSYLRAPYWWRMSETARLNKNMEGDPVTLTVEQQAKEQARLNPHVNVIVHPAWIEIVPKDEQ